MTQVIFTIYVEIPDNRLDNPAPFDKQGNQKTTDKSLVTKQLFSKFKNQLIKKQQQYASSIGAEYIVCSNDNQYLDFSNYFTSNYPQISEYDIVNFYKHHLMLKFAETYTQVCYLDLDVIPNTTESIFEAMDSTKFAVPDSNKDALWGKLVEPKYYNSCIRNPATKYWNAHAMLSEIDLDPDRDVFNTGIMVASQENINKLDYFGDFSKILELMTLVKTTTTSMYPKNIQRVFNYDNETVFSYKVATNNVPTQLIDNDWHCTLKDSETVYNENAKMYHVIDKNFNRFFK